MEKVGKAQVYAGEDTEGVLFDDVEIHSNGVVRASNRQTWKIPDIGTMLGETQVVYYSPHEWTKVEPKTVRDYTLWVSDVPSGNDLDWVPVATCVTFNDLEPLAEQYLEELFGDDYKPSVLTAAFNGGVHYHVTTGEQHFLKFGHSTLRNRDD
ncbi:hypothetical protein BN970_06971 [Mycolicibacterium conceptionense]|uniref:Uncharacterized protein n=1 Tax=Mycolicibacterium conceptionense TaxID=451644 RepID=A0A0U1DYP1_9MYCO|nr:hypothetical protein [Mycolicibacterium conceptionense]ORV21651.1 hypothetical protein AWB98_26695 [Mycolicibacterium conceptionense]CQD25173.1 hypothetical protein BN970_06971 [Mycolicibacterium conceptionense]